MKCEYFNNIYNKQGCKSPNNLSTKNGTIVDKGCYDKKRCDSDEYKNCQYYKSDKPKKSTSSKLQNISIASTSKIKIKCPHCNKFIQVNLDIGK